MGTDPKNGEKQEIQGGRGIREERGRASRQAGMGNRKRNSNEIKKGELKMYKRHF